MTVPDTLNLIGLALDGTAAFTLLVSAPVPQRVTYFYRQEENRERQRKDYITRIAHRWGMIALMVGFLFQLAAQLLR